MQQPTRSPAERPTAGIPPGLARRAREAVAAAGRPLASAELAAILFGLAGPAAAAGRWAALVDGLLAADDTLRRRPDGWTLAAEPAAPPDDGSVVAIAVATTGADPRRHRIVRLSLVRRDRAGIVARFDSPLNPRRRLPRYLASAARVTQDAADEAPSFAEVLPEIRRLAGAGPLHAYGAGWVRAFLEAELARLDVPGWPVPFVELAAAEPPASARRKPTLASLAEGLGMSHPRPGFPPADADVAARVALALRDAAERAADACSGAAAPIEAGAARGAGRAAGSGVDGPAPPTFDGPAPPTIAGGASSAGATPDSRPEQDGAGPPTGAAGGWRAPVASPAAPALLDRRWLADVPSCPGVYVVEDADGAPLYVGKAVDLRRRLAAYVGRAFALHRQLDGLAVRAAGVRTEPCASDLEARLLEARLVRRLRPPFNVQRRARPSAGLLRVAPNDRAPSVRAVRAAAPDGALYFGPYRSARAARAHLELARAAFPDAFGRARPDLPARRAAVQAVGRLLSGQAGEALAALRERMARRGAAGDHLGVDRLRRAIRDVLALEPCPSPLLGISPAEGLLVLDPLRDGAGVRAHLLRDGHLVASGTVRADVRGADLAALAADLARDAEPPDDPDDAAIVLRWLSEPTEGRTIVPLRRLG